jgi:hypothetical protein
VQGAWGHRAYRRSWKAECGSWKKAEGTGQRAKREELPFRCQLNRQRSWIHHYNKWGFLDEEKGANAPKDIGYLNGLTEQNDLIHPNVSRETYVFDSDAHFTRTIKTNIIGKTAEGTRSIL